MAKRTTLKRGDTSPRLRFTLWDESLSPREPIDLSTATTVAVTIRHAATGTVILTGVPADVLTPAEGLVELELSSLQSLALLDGAHHLEARITWVDGGVQTAPSEGAAVFYVEGRLA